jgi:putative transposase
MAAEVAAAVIEERQKHPRWGARKLRAALERRVGKVRWPAASSIGNLLRREGLIVSPTRRHRTPPWTEPLQHAGAPNLVWCADFKGWFVCGDGSRCDPLTTTDAYSRFLLRCRSAAKTDGLHVRALFEAMFQEYGLPEAIRTDNGPPFASPAPGGVSRLWMWWMHLGIRHERIEAGHPEQNGRHERMHRTLKAETANPPQASLRQQQIAFERFEQEYNFERPHEALGNCTPGQLYTRSTRSYPRRLPELEYPAGAVLRRISQQGSLKWGGERTFVSEVLGHENVGLVEIEKDLYEVYYGMLLLGWFEAAQLVFIRDRAPARRRRQRAAEQLACGSKEV